MENATARKTTPLFIMLGIMAICLLVLLGWPALNRSMSSAPTPTSSVKYAQLASQGANHFVVVDQSISTSRADLYVVAQTVCGQQSVCIVHLWDNQDLAALSLPMTDQQVRAKIAQYNRNQNSGLDRLLLCKADGCQ